MKKPMLCFDIDGTLRDNVHHQVLPSTLKALHMLKENGYKLVISTGRGVDSFISTGIMDLLEWDGYVCNNGQIVLNSNRKELFHASLKHQSVLETLAIAKELNLAVVLKSQPRIITKEPDEYVLESQRFFKNVIPAQGEYTGQRVDAMIVYGPKDYDYEPFMHIDGVCTLPGESTYADLTVDGISKATGINILLDLHHLNEYIAFGDSLNDMEMFKHASYSVAMGQGNEQLKKVASFITKPIDQDGIYYACQQLNLI